MKKKEVVLSGLLVIASVAVAFLGEEKAEREVMKMAESLPL